MRLSAPWVDVVFGTHNIGSLPALLERARTRQESQVEILEALDVFPSTLPSRRELAYAAVCVGVRMVLMRPAGVRPVGIAATASDQARPRGARALLLTAVSAAT